MDGRMDSGQARTLKPIFFFIKPFMLDANLVTW
jgi:hypothetical protein